MRIIESKYKTGKIITNFSSFVGYLNESQAYSSQEIHKKINRATLWISINKGFYGELLSHINIWGTYELNPNTITTNGRDIIFHPDFIMSLTDEELRFCIIHEILHCISEHQERRDNRDPEIWNIACDYAINPLLKDESGIKPPRTESRTEAFIYDKRFLGARVEDIYDILIKESSTRSKYAEAKTGLVIDSDIKIPSPDPDLIVYLNGDENYEKSDEEEYDEEPGEGEPGEGQPGEGEPGEGQPGEGQPGEGEPGEGEPGEGQPGEGEPGEGQPGEGQPGEGEPGEGQPGEGEPGEGEPGEGEPGEGEPGEEGGNPIKVNVGDRVMTNKGEGVVTKLYPNGDIEVNLD